MKLKLVAATCLISLCSNLATAQNPNKDGKKGFEAGKPLGSKNEAGKFIPLSDNVKVYGSFRFAESCTFDPARNLIVVMNAGVPQNQEENDGYVSLLNPDGTVHTSKWIGASRDGLTLNQPLGSAIQGNVLYAADIDVVRTFDLTSGKPLKSYPVEGAKVLNGIAVSKDGTIFVSNTRPDSIVYKITPAGEVSKFVEGAPLINPNGVAIDNDGHVVVVNVGDNNVLTFDAASGKLLKTEQTVESGNDGVVVLPDGTKYVSSVRYGSVSEIRPGQAAKIIAAGIPSAASMCYDSKQHQLVIPMNSNNALAFIKLEK
ncbi:beta-propeller fold lactonase family protein [Planctomicrobium sp. SH664]|uniref:beta-propeller fold lactonase family protein n=1 Tax=Planctomicrobium sp. SH664 TaxID=3448125 RepID=UPI003F5C0A98